MTKNTRIGTCSWNYDSWVGLVYSEKRARAAEYLAEYAQHFDTVEVDSWFYKSPSSAEVLEYLEKAGENLLFSCKLFQRITLTHLRTKRTEKTLQINPDFLSVELFNHYVSAIKPMVSQPGVIELEFEYLNRDKMPSLDHFLKKLDLFLSSADRSFPLAVETRNKNYLHQEYFALLKKHGVAHVFSEKLYMPHIYDVYSEFSDHLTDTVVLRLLGGDRSEIEKKTGNRWDTIVDEKSDLPKIAEMARDIEKRGKKLLIYANNHYEGSAIRTIYKLKEML